MNWKRMKLLAMPNPAYLISTSTKIFPLNLIGDVCGDTNIGNEKRCGCHAEALEACALGISNYALTIMHGVQAFARMLRVPQHDTLF